MNPFKPEGATTKITVAGTASAATKLTDTPDCVRICNAGTAIVWVKFGDSSVAATTSDYPVPAGMTEVIRPALAARPLYVSVIASAATGDTYYTPGSGL